MENIDFAKKLFKTEHINLEVQQAMDWDTLELWDTALVGENKKQIYADVVYRVFTKDQSALFLFSYTFLWDTTLATFRVAKQHITILYVAFGHWQLRTQPRQIGNLGK